MSFIASRFSPLIAAAFFLLTAALAYSRVDIPHAAQPQLSVSSDGRVWLTYAKAGDVFVAISTDDGATFNDATKVARPAELMVGMRRGPRVVAVGEHVTVTVIAHELLAFHSSDGGKTWGEAVTVNDTPTSAREGLHDLAAAPDGRLFVTWLDLRSGKMELWGALSSDGGRTWGINEPVYRSPDGAICTCCQPSALFDDAGNLALMWRNDIAGARDMWLITRANGADNFSAPRKLGNGSWQIDGCPMDGGRIVALQHGQFASVWQRAGEVFFSPAEGAEVSLGQGKQPVAVSVDGAPIFVWQEGADLCFQRGFTSEKQMCARNARFPSLVALSENKGAVLAYERTSANGEINVTVERL